MWHQPRFQKHLRAEPGGATAKEAFRSSVIWGRPRPPAMSSRGYMIVRVLVQMMHRAEFIELTFKQKIETAG
jgi:hypothetical protein